MKVLVVISLCLKRKSPFQSCQYSHVSNSVRSNMHHPSFGQSLFPGASSTSIKYLSIPCAFSCTVLALSNYNDLDCYLLLVFLLLPPVPYPTAFPPPRPQPTALLVPPEPPPHPPHPPPASPGDPQWGALFTEGRLETVGLPHMLLQLHQRRPMIRAHCPMQGPGPRLTC